MLIFAHLGGMLLHGKIWQFFVHIEQLNSGLKSLLCSFNSPKANLAIKPLLPLRCWCGNSPIAHVPWQMWDAVWLDCEFPYSQYKFPPIRIAKEMLSLMRSPLGKDKAKGADSNRKMESINSYIPKKAKKCWTEKHYRVHTPYITPRSASAKTGMEAAQRLMAHQNHQGTNGKDDMKFTQVIHAKCRKAFCTALKKSNHSNTCQRCTDYSKWLQLILLRGWVW